MPQSVVLVHRVVCSIQNGLCSVNERQHRTMQICGYGVRFVVVAADVVPGDSYECI